MPPSRRGNTVRYQNGLRSTVYGAVSYENFYHEAHEVHEEKIKYSREKAQKAQNCSMVRATVHYENGDRIIGDRIIFARR